MALGISYYCSCFMFKKTYQKGLKYLQVFVVTGVGDEFYAEVSWSQS